MSDADLRPGGFYPLAYYITKRRRTEWLEWPDDALLALVRALPRQRLVISFGGGREAVRSARKRSR